MNTLILLCVSQVSGQWFMWGGENSHQSLQTMKGAITSPVLKWGLDLQGKWVEWQFSGVADVDEDGHSEVIINCTNGSTYCVDGATGVVEWQQSTKNNKSNKESFAQLASPLIADVDMDGHFEIVIGTQLDGVFCLAGSDGSTKWQSLSPETISGSPATADLDGDGQLEIVMGSDSAKVLCVNGSDGSLEWSVSTGGRVFSSPAIGDVDGDGQMEVVVGSYDSTIYCLSGIDGSQKWAYRADNRVFASPALVDVNNDGTIEVLAADESGNVFCLDGSTGSQLWQYKGPGSSESSPSIADVDRDGQLEMIVGLGKIAVCLNASSGNLKWQTDSMPAMVYTAGALVDIDGDNNLEYLVSQGGSGDTLFCLNAEDGSLAWKIQLAEDIHTPFAADIDDDGCSEVIAGTRDTSAQGYSYFAIDDPGNTTGCGLLNTGEERTFGSDLDFRLLGPDLYLFTPNQTQVSLELFDASGRLVQTLFNGVLSPGGHTFVPNIKSKGVYIAVLKYQGRTQSVKMLR